MNAPQAAILPDGRRLHLQHGPIDLVIEAFGARDEIAAAYRQAQLRFETVLSELVQELATLRRPVAPPRWEPEGAVARRMMSAVWPHRDTFVTPMAAVAGAVADEIMAALCDGRQIDKAYINNSGDIALYMAPGETFRLGIVGELDRPAIDGTATLCRDDGIGGVATSGWRGRSWSFGVADAVTVLSRRTAEADVAATLIANAVNIEDPAIARAPASSLDDQTDLGDRLVTTAVGALAPSKVAAALDAGAAAAERMAVTGQVVGAALMLYGEVRVVGKIPAPAVARPADALPRFD